MLAINLRGQIQVSWKTQRNGQFRYGQKWGRYGNRSEHLPHIAFMSTL